MGDCSGQSASAEDTRERRGKRPQDRVAEGQCRKIGEDRGDQRFEVELAGGDKLPKGVLSRGEGRGERLAKSFAPVHRALGIISEGFRDLRPAGRSLLGRDFCSAPGHSC